MPGKLKGSKKGDKVSAKWDKEACDQLEGFRGCELERIVGDGFFPQLSQFAPGIPVLQPVTPSSIKQAEVAATIDNREKEARMANRPLI